MSFRKALLSAALVASALASPTRIGGDEHMNLERGCGDPAVCPFAAVKVVTPHTPESVYAGGCDDPAKCHPESHFKQINTHPSGGPAAVKVVCSNPHGCDNDATAHRYIEKPSVVEPTCDNPAGCHGRNKAVVVVVETPASVPVVGAGCVDPTKCHGSGPEKLTTVVDSKTVVKAVCQDPAGCHEPGFKPVHPQGHPATAKFVCNDPKGCHEPGHETVYPTNEPAIHQAACHDPSGCHASEHTNTAFLAKPVVPESTCNNPAGCPGPVLKAARPHDVPTVQEAVVVKPLTRLEAVVYVNKAGKPLCTITETVTIKPTPVPVKYVATTMSTSCTVKSSKEETTTTTLTSKATTTVYVPVHPTQQAPPPVVPVKQAFVGKVILESPGKPQYPQPHVIKVEHGKPVYPQPEVIKVEHGKGLGLDKPTKPAVTPVGSKHLGISYAAYRGNHACKSSADIQSDFSRFLEPYSVVRIYGTDCDQVDTIYPIAKPMGIKLFLGVWDINAVEAECQKIISGVKGDWAIVDTISVGNELVNNGKASPQQVVAAVNKARSILRRAGYQGPVVVIDTFIAVEAHPELCEASDYCAINAHAFFDPTCTADNAGPWLRETMNRVQSKLSVKQRIVITETGWPTQGVRNGLAVPGMREQKTALQSIRESFVDCPEDVILFSAFNDLWKKKDMVTFNSDQYWGIDGAVSTCDQ